MAFRLKDVRWRTKLLACFTVIILVGLIPVAITIVSLQRTNEALAVTQAEHLEMEQYSELVRSAGVCLPHGAASRAGPRAG